MAKVTVVGLGPGSLGQISLETYDLLMSGNPVYMRTSEHPCVEQLRERGVVFQTFDRIYASASSFEQVYQEIAEYLTTAAKSCDVIYAVPGHPRVGERSVEILLNMAALSDAEVEIKNAMSFLDPLFTSLDFDPIHGAAVSDGSVALKSVDYQGWLIISQVYDKMIASERKLDLMNFYPDEFPVYVIKGAGLAQEQSFKIPLYQLDRGEYFDPLTCIAVPPLPFELQPPDWDKLLEVMARLRQPGGCPWDIEQTHASLRPYLLEETFEVLEALDMGDMHKLCEELGDLLLQIVFHAELAQERHDFTAADVVKGLVEKLVRRHPHVFAGVQVVSAGEVAVNWDRIKEEETGRRSSVLDGLTKGLTSLMYARKVQSRAAKVGFDWPDQDGPAEKIREELAELLAASSRQEQIEELGDLLFAVVNLSRFLDIEPELALRGSVDKFIKRFKYIEENCRQKDVDIQHMSLEEMEKLWQLAKRQ